MQLPHPRGPRSAGVIEALRHDDPLRVPLVAGSSTDALVDDDLQLALWACYELHYRGFDDVDDRWEWRPELIALRSRLEDVLLDDLRARVDVPVGDRPVAERLRALIDADDGPSLSRHLQTNADADQFREFVRARSVYQLKEADPHTWAIPRLRGRSKAALVEIQTDEYGAGDPARIHAHLFASLMTGLGLDTTYGGYVDTAPAVALALSNVMSMFGLRRDLRGALVGQLAAYEMTSSEPCRRYARGLRRLGGDDAACAFFDAHVMADALHEQIAAHDLCGGLADDEPQLTEDIIFGAATSMYVERRFAGHLLDRWAADEALAVAS